MPKRAVLFVLNSHVVFLALACLVAMLGPYSAQSSTETPAGAGDMGLSPSDEEQFGDIIRHLDPDETSAGIVEDEGPPQDALSQFQAYLRQNQGEWYVVLTQLALAAFFGLTLALVYRLSYTGKKKKYSRSMMQSQVLLAIGGAFIWILVADFLVRAFGLAGMVGLIRYRTPVRDPKDNVMVFLSMGIGMACGLMQITTALVATGFISLVLLAMHEFGFGKKKKAKTSKPSSEEPDVED